MDSRTLHNRAVAARWLEANELRMPKFPFVCSLTTYWLLLVSWALWVSPRAGDRPSLQGDMWEPVGGWVGGGRVGTSLPVLGCVSLDKRVHLFGCQFSHPPVASFTGRR